MELVILGEMEQFNDGIFGNESTGTNSTWFEGTFNGGKFVGRVWNRGEFNMDILMDLVQHQHTEAHHQVIMHRYLLTHSHNHIMVYGGMDQ